MAVLLLAAVAVAEPPPPVPTLVTYRKELGLTDAQVASIQKMVDEFRQQAGTLTKSVKTAEAQVNADLAARAELPTLKTHLQAYYDARCQLHFADLASGRRLEQLLTKEQLERWRALQAEARKKSQLQPK